VGGVRLEQRRRDGSNALAQRSRGEPRRASADRDAAARPGASAVRHDGGVPRKHRHVIEWNVELVGDDLRERRVGALALVGDAL
jgi:hypothetical protein